MAKRFDTFFGANTPAGFVSLFDELYDPYGKDRTVILKGGPGTGKSTLMRRAADPGGAHGPHAPLFCARVFARTPQLSCVSVGHAGNSA